ncbi:hypothetical protein NNJEOMEG_01888 [Fundidesulfovibrio magnetotacticus]|uniref:Uncharacterized protein n=1 Tax=Fundidesulfovibrio magnetotacticus TaxID=2730080 RepID=A0A6V8LVB8_9BACT|nr:hypothetical protein [Fundidesulfovibrio magnetotacticus]GFK94049.1 hypothetical protein NNJEOMEG_01888 [Fundidesulfovibrio magnetotacticus]
MTDQSPAQQSLDLLTIPATGYAAYWLSMKRLVDKRRTPDALAQELQYAAEPYTRLLLQAASSTLEEELLRRMAHAKGRALTRDWGRKLVLIRQTASAVAVAENPGKTLITLAGAFGAPVVDETRTMEQAQGLVETMKAGNLDLAVFPDVSHATRPDELILKLLFFALWARRHGKTGLAAFLPGAGFHYLSGALRLCIDGLDEPFIRRRLDAQARELLADARHKMRLGLELALAIRAKRPYDDVLALARSFLLDL